MRKILIKIKNKRGKFNGILNRNEKNKEISKSKI